MRKLVMGCAVAGLIALSPRSEARIPGSLGPQPLSAQTLPQTEIGLASWYGAERQGKPTASGESFDMNKLTAAHRKLPLGTVVRVTNLKNRKTTQLRINDRGPGPARRLIDVSWAAAKQLGFVKAGLTLVQVEVVRYPKDYFPQGVGLHPPQLD
jgi:rare lipoprotein A